MPFGPDDLLIGAGISAGAGLLSRLLSGDSERTQALKKLRDRISSIQQLSRGDIQNDLSSIDKTAKTTVTGALDQAALSTAGRQNAQASIISSLAPSLAQARVQREQQLKDYNRNLEFQKSSQIAQIDSQLDSDTPQQDVMNILGLGLQGAIASAIGRWPEKPEDPNKPAGDDYNFNMGMTDFRSQPGTTGMDLTPIPTPNLGAVNQLTLPPIDVLKRLKKLKGNAWAFQPQ